MPIIIVMAKEARHGRLSALSSHRADCGNLPVSKPATRARGTLSLSRVVKKEDRHVRADNLPCANTPPRGAPSR